MKKVIQLFIKFAVSCGLIWYLLSKTELLDVFASLKSANLFWLALAFATLYIGKVLTGSRWQILLAAQGILIPLRTLIASIFVGQFFNTFLPTTVGGDAMRAYDTTIHSKQSAKSVTSVFADRLIGVSALAVLAILGIGVALTLGRDVSFFLPAVIIVCSACAIGLYLSFDRALSLRLENLLRRLGAGKIALKLENASLSLNLLKTNKAVLWKAFAISIALQINVVLFYYFVSLSVRVGISILYFFIIIPVALVALLIPFSINGIGLREGIFVFLLASLNVPSEKAIAFSWLAFGLILTQGVAGGIIFALRGINFRQILSERSVFRKAEAEIGGDL